MYAAAICKSLLNDEAGFIVSAELALIATVAVLGLVVGLSEVAYNVNQELEDVGAAASGLDQTFFANCVSGHQGGKHGSGFSDCEDYCGGQWDVN